MSAKIELALISGMLATKYSDIADALQREWAGGEDSLLIRRYDAGDVDTIAWPNPDAENLRSALYDAREMGIIPDVRSVFLPDGSEFKI